MDEVFSQNLAIATAASRVHGFIRELSRLQKEKQKPLLFWFWDELMAIYFELRLVAAKHRLFTLLSNTSLPKCTDLSLLLWAGELLYRTGEFSHAVQCFNRVIEGLDHDDQNVRLRALTGRLESEIAIRLQSWTEGTTDLRGCRDAKTSYSIILRDLYAASPEVQASLKARLARMTICIGMLATGTQVSIDRKVYETTF